MIRFPARGLRLAKRARARVELGHDGAWDGRRAKGRRRPQRSDSSALALSLSRHASMPRLGWDGRRPLSRQQQQLLLILCKSEREDSPRLSLCPGTFSNAYVSPVRSCNSPTGAIHDSSHFYSSKALLIKAFKKSLSLPWQNILR